MKKTLLLVSLVVCNNLCTAVQEAVPQQPLVVATVYVRSLQNAQDLLMQIDSQGHLNWQAHVVLPENSSIDTEALSRLY